MWNAWKTTSSGVVPDDHDDDDDGPATNITIVRCGMCVVLYGPISVQPEEETPSECLLLLIPLLLMLFRTIHPFTTKASTSSAPPYSTASPRSAPSSPLEMCGGR